VAVAAPDLIRNAGVLSNVEGALSKVNNAVGQAVSSFGCPQLSQYNYENSQLGRYPGYSKLKKDGTYS